MADNLDVLLETKPTQAASQPNPLPGEGAIDALKFFAWLALVAGIIGAIAIWIMFGSNDSYSHPTNPLGVIAGIAVLLQGMFVCALFLVISSIAESLIFLRKKASLTIEN